MLHFLDGFKPMKGYSTIMSGLFPFRDINVHASPNQYAFSSPSTPSAPTLVIERPNGDIRLHDGPLLGTQRVSSIAGIMGIIQLKLGELFAMICSRLILYRQIYHCHNKSTTYGKTERTHGIQSYCYRVPPTKRTSFA